MMYVKEAEADTANAKRTSEILLLNFAIIKATKGKKTKRGFFLILETSCSLVNFKEEPMASIQNARVYIIIIEEERAKIPF